MRVESWQTGNAFSLTEAIVGPQVGPPLHVHLDADEVIYVLEGTVDFVCENERFRTGPGGLVVIPGARGMPFETLRTRRPARLSCFRPAVSSN